MTVFGLYFRLGLDHILDVQGYDHILFLVSLTVVYQISNWKKVLILVTAFTIGHTVTLALATFEVIVVSTKWIEFLIPLSIFLTALYNMTVKTTKTSRSTHTVKYMAALFFGLIHGMGFSNFLRGLLGTEHSIVKELLAFNLGLELGQIVTVLAILLASFLSVRVFRVKQREWNLILSGAAMGISFILMMERWPLGA